MFYDRSQNKDIPQIQMLHENKKRKFAKLSIPLGNRTIWV